MNGKLATPDVTQVQMAAAAAWVVGQLVAMGVIDNDTSQWVLQATVTVISLGWILGDAIIRNGRARAFLNAPKPIEGDGQGGTTLGNRGA